MNRRILHIVSTSILTAVLVGCGIGQPQPTAVGTLPVVAPPTSGKTIVPTAAAAATSTPAAPTPAPRTPTPTQGAATSRPTVVIPASGTATPAAVTPTPAPQQITFAPGATNATVNDTVAANSTASYLIEAEANQFMQVVVSPPPQPGTNLAVYGADGTVLQSPSAGLPGFSGYLPTTQNYIIALSAGGQSFSFTMNVIIPERLSFAVGATAMTVQGTAPANGTHYYIVGAQANQVMEVDLSPDQGIQLTIYGVDGTVLKNSMSNLASFRGNVPSTQDYIVAVSGGGAAISYTMDLIIPERIQFAPGTTSATIQASIAANSAQYYVVGAQANQVMDVNVSPQDNLRLSIYGLDGTVLMSGMGGGTVFHGQIPTTQDYFVVVLSSDQGAAYTMVVSIP